MVSRNCLISSVLIVLDLVGTGIGKLLLGKDMAFDLLNGGNSGNEIGATVAVVAGASSTVVDVDQREGSDRDEVGVGEMSPTLEDADGDGNDWNFLNLALCLCLKVSKKWSPGEGLEWILGQEDFFSGLSTRPRSLL